MNILSFKDKLDKFERLPISFGEMTSAVVSKLLHGTRVDQILLIPLTFWCVIVGQPSDGYDMKIEARDHQKIFDTGFLGVILGCRAFTDCYLPKGEEFLPADTLLLCRNPSEAGLL